MLKSGDSERVAELMRETAAAELVPRFRALASDEIRQKRPGDFVTIADELSEQRLAAGLAKILPGVPVVGEEAVEADPGLVGLIARPGEACWVVDPLDGTANFAAGKERFAMIVCLVQDTKAIAGWILDVLGGRMAVGLHGQGVTLDDKPIARNQTLGRPLIGYVGYRIRKEFDRQLPQAERGRLARLSTLNCAGAEYLEMVSGRADFCIYRITKPWDHAAGTLMMREAGGDAVRFNGEPYEPSQPLNSGLITAARADALAEARALFEAVRLPLLASLPKS
jgi:fructose-1,6-bisphosphatase/inositol monophosphatase family enzyme